MKIKVLLLFALLVFSTFSNAAEQLTWDKAELRRDGTAIEAIEKYILYHWFENILQPNIEIDGAAVVFSDTDRRIGLHVYEISTVENGQEGRRSYP